MVLPIAIPTYRRSATLWRETLAYLAAEQVPADSITLFVASEEERDAYIRATPKSLYGKIVVGVPGLSGQRNFIRDYYDEGEVICQMDDDVLGIKGSGFLEILERAQRELEDNCGLFGVLPNDDARRFKRDTTYHLTHILGSFFVCRNHKDIHIPFCEKEDYLRSILYFKKYGLVARYRGAGVKTNYNKGSGGLISNDRLQRMQEGAFYIVKTYPEYADLIEKKGMPDVALNWRAKSSYSINADTGTPGGRLPDTNEELTG